MGDPTVKSLPEHLRAWDGAVSLLGHPTLGEREFLSKLAFWRNRRVGCSRVIWDDRAT